MQFQKNQICPLCHSIGSIFQGDFFLCENCGGIFRGKHSYPTPSAEKKRYEAHNNNVEDKKYQQFVFPITRAVLKNYLPSHHGLDFGAGTGPVISYLLEKQGYQIKQYDPFFHNYPELLKQTYDYIVCCEVIEHFHNPRQEFGLLRRILKPHGSLFCMTHLYQPDINFESWYYKNDPTHVFIYQKQTLDWIKHYFNFSSVQIDNRFIQLNA
ncbi:MAG: class I SAM-dependent methyltransferase [Anaerolineales bacterium]